MGFLEMFDFETGPLLISLIITIPVIAYIYLKNKFNYWTKRGIPQVNATSFLYGNIKDVFYCKEYSGDVLQKIYDQFKGKQFGGYYEFINPVLMVIDPQLIQTVIVEKFASFHDNKLSRKNPSQDPNDVFANHPFILSGSKWKETRSVIASAFTPNKLRSLEEIIKSVYKNAKVYIDKNSDCIQAHDLTSRIMCEVVAAWGWGIDAHAFQEKSVVKEIFDKINFIVLSSFYMQLALFWPAVGNYFLNSVFPTEMSGPIKALTEQTLENSEKLKTSQSLLQTLLSIKEKNKTTDKELTKSQIIGHMASYYVDGYETTSRFIDYLLHQLVIHPDVQKKLREEVATLKEITIDGITKLEYLDMVVSESGRVITLAPFLSKICTEKIMLGSKEIDAGTGITIPVNAIHHDSEYYPDPYKFNPENFSEENRNKRHKYTYLPFGQGPRACVGMRHAITDTKLIVCYLLKDYELLLPDDAPSEQLKPLKQSSILFIPDKEPVIRFKKL